MTSMNDAVTVPAPATCRSITRWTSPGSLPGTGPDPVTTQGLGKHHGHDDTVPPVAESRSAFRSRTPGWRRCIMTMLRSGGWILLVGLAAPAAAQDPVDFGQLLGVIEPGDTRPRDPGRWPRDQGAGRRRDARGAVRSRSRPATGPRQGRRPGRALAGGRLHQRWLPARVRNRRRQLRVADGRCLPRRGGLCFQLRRPPAHGRPLRDGGRLDRRRRGSPDTGGGGLADHDSAGLERGASAGARPPGCRRIADLLKRALRATASPSPWSHP